MEISAQLVKQLRDMTDAGMMDCKKALVEVGGDIDKAVEYLREKGLSKAAKKADRVASEGIISVEVSSDFSKASMLEINSETDFVAKNDNFKELVAKSTKIVFDNSLSEIDSLHNTSIEGTNFTEFLQQNIAKIGENIVVRRIDSIQVQGNAIVNGYVHSNGRVGVLIAMKFNNANSKSKASELARNLCMHAAAMKPQVLGYKELDSEKELQENLKAQNKPEAIWDKILPGQMERFIADSTLLDQRLTLLGQFYVMDDKKTIAQVLQSVSKEINDELEITKYVRFELGEGIEKKVEDFAAEVAAQL